MKYRILEIDGYFYPQRNKWGMWWYFKGHAGPEWELSLEGATRDIKDQIRIANKRSVKRVYEFRG